MENWKPVWGFGDYYEVSDQGRVRSFDRYVAARYGERFCKGKVLSPRNNSSGYLFVTLHDAKTKRSITRYIHALVAESFLEYSRDGGMTVDHINADKSDNRLENLQVISQSDNSKRWRSKVKGFDTTRLTKDQVRWIRYMYGTGKTTYRQMSDALDVSWRTVQKVVTRETWKNVI